MPGLLLAALIIGGGSTYAFSGRQDFAITEEVLAGFSSDQQQAIKKAHEIRVKTRQEADDILNKAGVNKNDLRQAMREYRGKFQGNRQAVRSAIEASDYSAFLKAIAGTPGEGKVSEEQFDKLVEVHTLMKSGDKAQAFEIMKEAGFPRFFGMQGHRMMNK